MRTGDNGYNPNRFCPTRPGDSLYPMVTYYSKLFSGMDW